jgi:hypothetical protein
MQGVIARETNQAFLNHTVELFTIPNYTTADNRKVNSFKHAIEILIHSESVAVMRYCTRQDRSID